MGASREQVKDIFDKYAQEDGSLAKNDIHKLLKELQLPSSSQSLVQVQGALRYLYSASIDDGIPFALWWKWYRLEQTPGSYEGNNELLVRRVIEKVKLPTRNLKEGSFVYGQKCPKDAENAGEVILSWVTGKRSKSKEAGVSLIKVNKAAVKNKKLTPKELNRFLREHQYDKELQRPVIVGKKKGRGPKRDPTVTYGCTSGVPEFSNFSEIIFPDRKEESKADPPYVDTSGQTRKGKLPFPRQTKCSTLLATTTRDAREQQRAQEQETPWKMKKFDKVQAKLKVPRG